MLEGVRWDSREGRGWGAEAELDCVWEGCLRGAVVEGAVGPASGNVEMELAREKWEIQPRLEGGMLSASFSLELDSLCSPHSRAVTCSVHTTHTLPRPLAHAHAPFSLVSKPPFLEPPPRPWGPCCSLAGGLVCVWNLGSSGSLRRRLR